MPKPQKIFALDLGMQTIGLAEFATNDTGGITLNRFASTELMVDPAADATRAEQIRISVQQLRTELSARGRDKTSYCLPSQSVFTRFVKIPGSAAEQVTNIIRFEAQQNVPFPIDEVTWDFQIMGKPRNGNLDVALVAIKADQLSAINGVVQGKAPPPDFIDVAPMALYNAFRFNYSGLQGSSLLVDIGSRTTNLIFVEDDRAFSRSIPIGGNAISAAVAKEFNLDITTAENLKKDKGFVSLGGAYADPADPVEAKISKLVRNTLTRLHAEISRSISFYRANQGGTQPVRCLLCGGTVSLPYMKEFFSEKLQLPVEFFNPLQNVTVASEDVARAIEGKVHTLGEVVGIALRATGPCPVQINLRPPAVLREQDLNRRKPFLIMAAASLFLALGAWWLYFTQANTVKAEVLTGVQGEVQKLQKIAKEFDDIKADQDALEGTVKQLLAATTESNAWTQIIDELGDRLPHRFVWVTEIVPLSGTKIVGMSDQKSEGGASSGNDSPASAPPARPGQNAAQQGMIDAIQVKGLYLDNPNQAKLIDDYVASLQQSSVFSIPDASKAVTTRSTPDGETWAYGYTLKLPLKTPLPLP